MCRLTAAAVALLPVLFFSAVAADTGGTAQDSTAAGAVERLMASAEAALRAGEEQLAESRYRDGLLEGWLLLGALAVADGDLDRARDAFERAGTVAVERRRALLSLGLVELQRGEAALAVDLLRTAVALAPRDGAARQYLAQALVAAGHAEDAVLELEEAAARAPDDPEIAFALATAHLRLGKPEAAERVFAAVADRLPGAETWVLIGRTYRDFGDRGRAKAALERALALDPRARRVHFYLGTLVLQEEGPGGLGGAIAAFEEELRLAPDDPIAQLYLGLALVEARRNEEALAPLAAAARSEVCRRDALHFLGSAYLALDRPAQAAEALRGALAVEPGAASGADVDARQMASIHYQLATALRRLGDEAAAAPHFEAARRHSSAGVETTRDRLARYLAAEPGQEAESGGPGGFVAPLVSPLAGVEPARREEARRRITTAMARAASNLGILKTQAGRFGEAADLLRVAADLDLALPQVHRTLGVALFNARRYAEAGEALERALAEGTPEAALRHMTALAWLNAERPARAADLLRDDPARAGNRAFQYAYALALVRSGRPEEAEPVFGDLFARHADWPELNVLLGQAHAARGDYDAAELSLRRALELSPQVAEAHSTLGEIALRQGKLPEAEAALRAELAAHPGDERARYLLATVLQLAGRLDEAVELVRTVLSRRPAFADARYLLGKLLLERGDPAAASEQLAAAAKLAPDDANIRYQLAQAYQRLGKAELARQELEVYFSLKDRTPGGESR